MRSSLLIRAGMVAPVTIALPPTAGAQPPASADFLDAEGGAGQTLNKKCGRKALLDVVLPLLCLTL
ncbi:hypothetical protein PO78_2406 [Thauera sp. SWB20]|nr:hypothetical protein PO78_2406 [Thauera sp. SWB20]